VYRYFVELAYVGEAHAGWQRQKNAISVQQVVEETLSKVLRLPAVSVVGSGRTDTGVHARKQVFHVDLPQSINHPEDFLHRLNQALPKEIAFKSIQSVNADAHARFSAELRAYEYWLSLKPNPFLVNRAYFFYKSLHVDAMNEAARRLIGEHDFASFSKVNTDVHHFRCKVSRAEWVNHNEDMLIFHIAADRFLRGMVRAVVGTLLQVGLGKISISQFQAIIDAKDRKKAGQNAPAGGLYLTEVKYPDSIFNYSAGLANQNL
jgi:tRNA pseudouridine38-40 synthase